jgi:hypothetical protein
MLNIITIYTHIERHPHTTLLHQYNSPITAITEHTIAIVQDFQSWYQDEDRPISSDTSPNYCRYRNTQIFCFFHYYPCCRKNSSRQAFWLYSTGVSALGGVDGCQRSPSKNFKGQCVESTLAQCTSACRAEFTAKAFGKCQKSTCMCQYCTKAIA